LVGELKRRVKEQAHELAAYKVDTENKAGKVRMWGAGCSLAGFACACGRMRWQLLVGCDTLVEKDYKDSCTWMSVWEILTASSASLVPSRCIQATSH
jgi:hypothetical protein